MQWERHEWFLGESYQSYGCEYRLYRKNAETLWLITKGDGWVREPLPFEEAKAVAEALHVLTS